MLINLAAMRETSAENAGTIGPDVVSNAVDSLIKRIKKRHGGPHF